MAKSNLVIVESPAKAKTIGKYLGPDYQVLASMGHVRDLPKSKMGVDLESGDFTPNYQPIPGKEEVIEELKDAAVSRAVDLSAEKYCSVALMLEKAVKITHSYEVIEA